MIEETLTARCTTRADGTYDWSAPPAGAVPCGDGHAYVKLWWSNAEGVKGNPEPGDASAVWVGIDEWHRKANGGWCVGYCLFAVPEADLWAAAYVGAQPLRWTVTFDPLTMSPSIACKVCPSHGFIRAGQWS